VNHQSHQIAVWGELVGLKNASEPDDLVGLFQYFRPDGAGVEAVFSGVPFGDAVLERLRRVYQCTARGFDQAEAYFIPRPAFECPEREARLLLSRHFLQMSRVAEYMRDRELLAVLSHVVPARVTERAELNQIPNDSPDGWMFDMLTDYLGALKREESPVSLLRDAFYSVANDIFLRSYLMWPLFERAMPGTDPFHPYFDLWSKGVSYSFRDAESCRFFIAAG
jgi:hypothetical protein